MLRMDPNERWSTRELLNEIQEADSVPDRFYKFTGSCCSGAKRDITPELRKKVLSPEHPAKLTHYSPQMLCHAIQHDDIATVKNL